MSDSRPVPSNRRWIQHHTHATTERRWWQVLSELGADYSIISVCLSDLAPNNPDFAVVFERLCLVHEGNLLAEVKISSLPVLNAFYVNQHDARVLISLGPPV
eukprot:GHVO01010611.1.p1 GENE.GHVO01010611.1~~GHVO01010611.1.p1  ORF type:complete len:102 (-),score=3.28 GHVO01010611.1:24-329(-)